MSSESSQVVRQWGHYVDHYRSRDRVLKTLTVLPGRSTSLQLHHRRSEFWVVQSGSGYVTIGTGVGDAVTHRIVSPGCEVTVPAGVIHKISNTGDAPLVILELQHGPDCREDDIVRFVE